MREITKKTMPRRRRNVFRAYLIAIGLAVVPLTAFIIGAHRVLVHENTKRIFTQSSRSGKVFAALVERPLTDSTTYLQGFAQRSDVVSLWQRGSDDALATLLAKAHKLRPGFTALGLYDRDGRLRATSPAGVALLGPDYHFTALFSAIEAGRAAYVSPAFRPAEGPGYAVAIAVPVNDENGNLLGTMVGQQTLDTITHDVYEYATPENSALFFVVDQEGKIFGAQGSAIAAVPGNRSIVDRLAKQAPRDTGERLSLGSQEVIASYSPIGSAGWGILVSVPIKVITQTLWKSERTLGLLILIMLLLAVAGGGAVAAAFQRLRTREERYQNQLRMSESRLSAITETAADAILTATSQGNILYSNAAAARVFGYSAGELSGQPLTLLMPERFHTGHKEGLKRFLATREARVIGRSVELAGRRKDGTEFPLNLSLSSWEADGETFFTGILRDITEQKIAEDRLRLQNAQLAVANKELEAFSYSVSHDLRAPLRAIDGFSHALLEDCRDQLSPEGTVHLERIRAATARMGQLIDGMLALARTARSAMVREKVSLSSLAGEIVSHLQRAEPDRQVTVEIAPNLIVEGDRVLLQVMLENLLGNAWKFTSRISDARIEFGSRTGTAQPIYFVRDNGAGFDMKYADQLFGAFQRLHDARDYPGTGIGLATVQRIIQRHGGRVWAESELGRGTTFYFSFGVVDIPPASDAPEAAASAKQQMTQDTLP
jgi:PAS domain S-box-containing protein